MLMDWERQADWMLDADRVTVVSDSREGVGVRLAVRTRLFGIPAFTEPMEVIGWDPPRRLMISHGSARGGHRHVDARAGRGRHAVHVARGHPPRGAGRRRARRARSTRPIMRVLMGRAMDGLRGHLIATGPSRRS